MTRPGTVVFAGPSLPPEARPQSPALTWRPPAAAGDIADLAADPPQFLCLIDGLFDTCPAPWHKELLLIMAAGTSVLGASSMGALRAAELDRHGMTGVGAIYAAYRDGRLTGDDEVALIHATGRLDWAPLSVPLVEVRATLCAALRARLIGVEAARMMRDVAGAIYFADRDWPLLRARWAAERCCPPGIAAEIERRHVPLKRLDAEACLVAARHQNGRSTVGSAAPMTIFLSRMLSQRPRRPG